ncbi:Fis family transcriptional regulator [Burkholderia anthina]|nr:Fis family transcriptional regulator [Burkholderia anthina]
MQPKYPTTREELFDDLAPTIDETVRYRVGLYLCELHGAKPQGLHSIVMEQVERALLVAVLDYAAGNQALAADYLGLSRTTLIRKLKNH